MKKRYILIISLLIVLAANTYGEKTQSQGTLVGPNSFSMNIGLGLGYATGMRIGGGMEYGLGEFMIGHKVPFSYGIAGRMGLSLGSVPAFSAGAFGTLHFSWGALKLPKEVAWMGNFDTYLGLGVLVVPYVDFDSIGGLSYYFSKNVALNLEAGLKASYIGLLFLL